MIYTAVLLYMSQDFNNAKGKYLEYKQFLNQGCGVDRKVIFLNYHDHGKYLCDLIKKSNYRTAVFIIFICKEHYRETENIKEINRFCTPFWFPFEKNKFRDINLFIFIEILKLIYNHRDMKIEVFTSTQFLHIAIGYINKIFNTHIKIQKPSRNIRKQYP